MALAPVDPVAPAFHPPRVPPWAVNAALTLLIASLWPIGTLIEDNLNPYFYNILIIIGVNIILAVSLNLINGVTGQFSLGHAGFMAVGAYVTGSVFKHYSPDGAAAHLAFLGLVVAGGLAAAAAGIVIGVPTLRLRGDYLAVATLGFGEIIRIVINNTDHVGPFHVGAASGLHGIPNLPLGTYFFWAYGWVILCVVAVWRIVHSPMGKAFVAIREDEIAAAAMGIDTTFFKVAAFVIGAFFAGVAGGIQALWLGNLDPNAFGFMKSIDIVVMVVLGGSGSITGAVAAAVVLTYLPEQLRFAQAWRMVIYSLLLIVMMLVRPEGLLGRRELWWTRKRLASERGGGAVTPAANPPINP